MKSNAKTRGIVAVVAAFILMFGVYGTVSNCYAFYIEPVTEALGFSRQGYSFSQTIVFISVTVASLLAGRIYKRFNKVDVMRAALIALVVSYAAYGFCTKLWQFYALSAVIGASLCLTTSLPLSIILHECFTTGYGLAVGVAFMGSGIGGMALSPVVRALIDGVGYRMCFLYMAGIMGIPSIIAAFVLIKRKGGEGKSEAESTPTPEEDAALMREYEASLTGKPMRDTLRDPRYYISVLLSMFMGVIAYGLCTFISPYYIDLGHDAGTAALCASIAMGAMAVGKIIVGRLYDRTGVRLATLISAGAAIVGYIGYILSDNIYMFVLVALGVGFCCPFGTVALPMVVRGLFGTRDFDSKLGPVLALDNLGAGFSPFFAGIMYDAFGGYGVTMKALLILSAVVFVAYIFVIPGKKREGR